MGSRRSCLRLSRAATAAQLWASGACLSWACSSSAAALGLPLQQDLHGPAAVSDPVWGAVPFWMCGASRAVTRASRCCACPALLLRGKVYGPVGTRLGCQMAFLSPEAFAQVLNACAQHEGLGVCCNATLWLAASSTRQMPAPHQA